MIHPVIDKDTSIVRGVHRAHKVRTDAGELVDSKPPTQPDGLTLAEIAESDLPANWREAMRDGRLEMPDPTDASTLQTV